MASGKTTFGRALARKCGREFIDLDFYISQRFRSSIPEIFNSRGEEGFRKLEGEMLREVGEFENVVIACGGGTPCHNNNMKYMKERGMTVWLQASVGRIVERLLIVPDKRPLTAALSREELPEFVERHLAQRTPFYSAADILFTGENLENKHEISDTVDNFLNSYIYED